MIDLRWAAFSHSLVFFFCPILDPTPEERLHATMSRKMGDVDKIGIMNHMALSPS